MLLDIQVPYIQYINLTVNMITIGNMDRNRKNSLLCCQR